MYCRLQDFIYKCHNKKIKNDFKVILDPHTWKINTTLRNILAEPFLASNKYSTFMTDILR